MRLTTALAVLALAAPVSGQQPVAAVHPAAGEGRAAPERANVRVTATILVVDRDALRRAGLSYVVLGNDRVRVSSNDRRGGRGARIAVGTHGVTAFLDAVRDSRWVRSETTQQVLTVSGGEALVSSTDLSVGRHSARTRGPSLAVIPRVQPDGRVRLQVSARLEDAVRYGWGYGVDGSPAAVETEVVARDGEELLLASSSTVETTRESGLLGWSAGEQGRDVLVTVTAHVMSW